MIKISNLKIYENISDEDVLDMTAYNNKCIDIYGNGAYLAYDLEITNFNGNQDMIGTIDFNVDGIENLSYIVLDEEGNKYLGKTSVKNGITENMSLGEHFLLNNATESNPSKRNFTLIVWLTNLNEDQTDFDAGGSFTASVSYESAIYGSKLTGTIYGREDENPEINNAGGDLA